MQLALNSGQYLAICVAVGNAKRNRSTEIPGSNFSSSGLDRLQTYLFDEDIQNISLQISDRLLEGVKEYLVIAE